MQERQVLVPHGGLFRLVDDGVREEGIYVRNSGPAALE